MRKAFIALFLFVATASTHAAAEPMPRAHAGFRIERIATVPGAREIVIAPNGDLFAGTTGADVYIVRNVENAPSAPAVFLHLPDDPAAGVALAANAMFIGTQSAIWKIPYRTGDRTAAAATKIASIRTGGTGGHSTTSLAVSANHLFASVGSSCNACAETDPTRATIQEMDLGGSHMHARATHIRNAIALAVNPQTATLWAGSAGQDELEHGHPFELFDAVTAHTGTADYGWPLCYENRRPVHNRADCSSAVVPRVVFPAYETPVGAVFYPRTLTGKYVFPKPFRFGAFVTLHGSWHTPHVPPRIVFVPMNGDVPDRAVAWNNPESQWTEFAGGFQLDDGTRIARPTGITVGPQGSLFFSDDQTGGIYRIRPAK